MYIGQHFHHVIPKGSTSLCEMGGFGLEILLLCAFALPIPYIISCIIVKGAFPHKSVSAFAGYCGAVYIFWIACYWHIAGALTSPSYFDDRPLLAISLFPLIPAIAVRVLRGKPYDPDN